MTKLALLGGPAVRTEAFPPHPIIGEAERRQVADVLDSGQLSTFIAAGGSSFLGGRKIRAFEDAFASYIGSRYAVAFNSATSALHAAVVAVGVAPGEEVIVPPYTFTSTATCVLMHDALPRFADVEERTYGLDPAAVEAAITPRTRALIPVHLFGHPARMDELLTIARRHDLKVIEDCAQAPGADYRGRKLGSLGDCGVFSFTENKNMATGEGGMLVTDDEALCETARLVRNHGEVIPDGARERSYSPTTLGWNYRMTELEAALGLAQLEKLDGLNGGRADLAARLSAGLADVKGLETPVIEPDCTHAFYVYVMQYDEGLIGIPRARFAEALKAEGIPLGAGYVPPLYWSPLYTDQRATAFMLARLQGHEPPAYERGMCPVTERLHTDRVLLIPIARPPSTRADMDDVLAAIDKVLANRDELVRS